MSKEHGALPGNVLAVRMHNPRDLLAAAKSRGAWKFTARDKDGNVKWEDEIDFNIVTNAGLDHLLDVTLSGGTQITTWYLGLTDGTPTVAAGDTSASHVGWVEINLTLVSNCCSFISKPTA